MRPADLLHSRAFRAIAISGAALAVAGGAAVAAQASGVNVVPFLAASPVASSSPQPGASSAHGQWCTVFLGHLSADLGVSQDKLASATVKAARQTIEDAVAKGKLTRAQADRLEARLSSGSLCKGEIGALHRGRGLVALRGELVKAAATVLKLTPQQLVADLRQGQSLSSIAQRQGIPDEATFRTDLAGALKPDLAAAVKGGTLTQAQETAILNQIANGPIPFWNHGPGKGWERSQASPSGTAAASA